ncbi:MAG: glycine cleavage system aminomethyltransferase GcvT [Verrucomicrobiota bacterium]
MLKRTPLFAAHQKLGGKLIEFGGWEMPVQYTSIMDEHHCVRRAAGLFDISHMGEVLVGGPGAVDFLNGVLTNDLRKLEVGQGQYTLMCNEQGGVLDDLYAYRVGERDYCLIVNASRIEVDVAWLVAQWDKFPRRAIVKLENVSAKAGAVAVQGPRVAEFVDACFPGPSQGGRSVARATELKKNQVTRFESRGIPIWVARTGYTGEDGFEVFTATGLIEQIWNKLLELGKPFGIKPTGLGARDTLRTEMGYPLYGHELDEQTTPIEAGLGRFVSLDKGEFIGRAVLAGQVAGGIKKQCVAFRMVDKSAPPRPQYPIWSTDGAAAPVGVVVSGTQSPSLNVGLGMGYVPPAVAKLGTRIDIEIRGKRFAAEVAAKPLYQRPPAGLPHR